MDSDEIVDIIVGLVIFSLLTLALGFAFQANWPAAIFTAIIWNGAKSTRIRQY